MFQKMGKRRLFVLLLGFLLVGMVLAGCGGNSGERAASLEKFEILIDWYAEPTYLGIYYARHLGLFERIGLDVEIVEAHGANRAVAAVASGKYPIGTASGGATVLGYNNGAKVVSLGVLYKSIPSVVYGLASVDLGSPQFIYGKKVGIYPGSITKNEFDAFVKINSLDPKKFEVISLSGPDLPLLSAGQVDVVLNYWEMSPAVLAGQHNGEDGRPCDRLPSELKLAEWGVGGYGLNVITNRGALESEGKRVMAVYEAILEGYARGCKNPDDAVQAFVAEFPDKDASYIRTGWARVCCMINEPQGAQEAAGWQETIDLYRQLGLLERDITPSEIMP